MPIEQDKKIPEKQQVHLDPSAFQRDLEAILDDHGVPCGRLQSYWEAESVHVHAMRANCGGTLLVARAYQSMFLEAIELLNKLSRKAQNSPELPFYKRNFAPHLLHEFQHICATELAATHGYPLPAYAMLRNILDNLILISAAMQGMTDFFKIEGNIEGVSPIDKESRSLRKKTERTIRQQMTGAGSGLSVETTRNLALLDNMFDLEVHGARLSHATAKGWIDGTSPLLPVIPEYNLHMSSLYANRLSEIVWMAHRLLPLFQHSALEFPETWKKKWQILDGRFEDLIRHLAAQQETKVGLAIIDFVKTKFPFDENTRYPLEGLELTFEYAREG